MNREIKFRAWNKDKNRWENEYDELYLGSEGDVYTI